MTDTGVFSWWYPNRLQSHIYFIITRIRVGLKSATQMVSLYVIHSVFQGCSPQGKSGMRNFQPKMSQPGAWKCHTPQIIGNLSQIVSFNITFVFSYINLYYLQLSITSFMVQTTEDKLFLEQKLESPQRNHNRIFYSSPKIWGEITPWLAHRKSLTNIHFMYIIELQYSHFQISELP